MVKIGADLLHVLQHSLGLNKYGQGNQYRNHYVAGADDAAKCRELVAMGYMAERPSSELTGGDPLFHVTPAGIDVVALQSPAPPKLTRSQKRYREYLNAADSFKSFWHFLRYEQAKKRGEIIEC